MRSFSPLVATFVFAGSLVPIGCSTATEQVTFSDSGGPVGPNLALGASTQLAAGSVSVSSVTSDGWVVFRDADVLRAVKIAAEPAVQDIMEGPGNVLVRGMVLFNWSNVDWTVSVGDLSVWTASGGTHHIGETTYTEGLVAASEQGRTIVYTANMKATTMDLMIAPSDLSAPKVLIEAMGRGSDTTCGANIGFVGERLFVGWCPAGTRNATIDRFEEAGGTWTRTRIADDALPAWSADASGERVFYQSSGYAGHCADKGEQLFIDGSVSSGFILPDGSAALYTVGDQLRRTTLPTVNPLSIVTRGYAQVAAWSSGFDLVLFSTKVTYDQGTRRDLLITPTGAFNPSPAVLESDPVAGLARSSLTKDGRFAFYMTDTTPSGGTLHVRTIDGAERMTLPGVVEVVAVHDATIVFTDGSSDPNQYPIVADLKVLDLATSESPTLIESKILEARNFQLDPTGKHVIYVRSGIDRDASPEREGLFLRTIP